MSYTLVDNDGHETDYDTLSELRSAVNALKEDDLRIVNARILRLEDDYRKLVLELKAQLNELRVSIARASETTRERELRQAETLYGPTPRKTRKRATWPGVRAKSETNTRKR